MRNLATFSHASFLSNQTLERLYIICSTFLFSATAYRKLKRICDRLGFLIHLYPLLYGSVYYCTSTNISKYSYYYNINNNFD